RKMSTLLAKPTPAEPEWWKTSVVYQIYPRSFFDSNGDGIGDLNGITMKLDYLKKLGVGVVWLSPVYDSPNYDNGYDIRNYTKIMDEFGTMEDFDNLLKGLHERKIKLIMDLVVNHTSDEHDWFVQSKSSKDNPYRDFYHWAPPKDGKPPTQWGACFGGSTWTYDIITGQYYLHTFTEKQPDLKWENPAVRNEVYKLMRWWLDKGIDGFRMDVINFISKAPGYPEGARHPNSEFTDGSPYFINGPKIHEYLQEMNEKVLRHYDIMSVGETPDATVYDAELFTFPERKELNMIFTFEHMNLDGGKWTPKLLELTDLKHHFTLWQKDLWGKGWNSLYWNNHDQPRIVSRFGNDSNYRVESAKMLATCLHFLCGTPYIYQGEEIGMTNVRFQTLADYRDIETINFHDDAVKAGRMSMEEILAAIYAKSRDNGRTPIQWTAKEPYAGFTNGHETKVPWIGVNDNYIDINVEQALDDPNSIFYYYQKLIQLRKQMSVITYGKYEILYESHTHLYMYKRYDNDGEVYVCCNFSQQPIEIDDQKLIDILNSGKIVISNYSDPKYLRFRAYEAYVIEVKNTK
ncbi:unnamed protein product, partial [Didymodactylos carnosus]